MQRCDRLVEVSTWDIATQIRRHLLQQPLPRPLVLGRAFFKCWIGVCAAYDAESLADCLAVLVSFYRIQPGPGSISASRLASHARQRNQGSSVYGLSQRPSRLEFYLPCQPGRTNAP